MADGTAGTRKRLGCTEAAAATETAGAGGAAGQRARRSRRARQPGAPGVAESGAPVRAAGRAARRVSGGFWRGVAGAEAGGCGLRWRGGVAEVPGPPGPQPRAAALVPREQMKGSLVPLARSCWNVLGGGGKGPKERGVAGGVPASSRLAGQVPRGPGWRPVLPWPSLEPPPRLR